MQITLQWVTSPNGYNYSLSDLNLASPHFTNLSGVYMIWHSGTNPAVVRVGQGVIGDRLGKHRQDPKILAYQSNGLYVTWSSVPLVYVNGVERYLAETWNPKVGDKFPDVPPIGVNSPWS